MGDTEMKEKDEDEECYLGDIISKDGKKLKKHSIKNHEKKGSSTKNIKYSGWETFL